MVLLFYYHLYKKSNASFEILPFNGLANYTTHRHGHGIPSVQIIKVSAPTDCLTFNHRRASTVNINNVGFYIVLTS